jgi:Tol biopolymer transport system component
MNLQDLFVVDTGTKVITSTDVGSTDTQLITVEGLVSALPQINADGTRIAFDPNISVNGLYGIFLIDIDYNSIPATSTVTSVWPWTGPQPVGSNLLYQPAINADGTRIAFWGHGPANDPRAGLFLFDRTTNTYTQIIQFTAYPTGSPYYYYSTTRPSISADGTRIAFVDYGNLTGENPNLSPQLFVYDTITSTIHQITNISQRTLPCNDNGACENILYPQISADGTRVIFESNCQDLRQMINPYPDPYYMELFMATLPF